MLSQVLLFYNARLNLKLRVVAGSEFYFGCGLKIRAQLSTTSEGSCGEWPAAYRRPCVISVTHDCTRRGATERTLGVNISHSRAFLLLLLYWCLSCLYLPVPNPIHPRVKQLDLFLFFGLGPSISHHPLLEISSGLLFLTLYLCDIS